jgi:predicted transcriptional regulator YheO
MPSLFILKTTPTFERGFRALTKRDPELQEQFVKVVDILRRLRYDIFEREVILHSFNHRKEAY